MFLLSLLTQRPINAHGPNFPTARPHETSASPLSPAVPLSLAASLLLRLQLRVLGRSAAGYSGSRQTRSRGDAQRRTVWGSEGPAGEPGASREQRWSAIRSAPVAPSSGLKFAKILGLPLLVDDTSVALSPSPTSVRVLTCSWLAPKKMSRTLVQPVGQKRLTNVAVVRLRKHGQRFEIACFPNKVLSWGSRVEKDIDEVLQSHTVYSNVSKGVLAKSKDLIKAFSTDDQTQICIEILEKGELQVSGKEREAQLSSQFRDIATIVMEKTINPETRRPYTITMIERLMHEIHFAVDPNLTSKEQALKVIKKLIEHFPIKRAPLRVRFTAPKLNFTGLMEKVAEWNAAVISKDESGTQPSIVCEIEPSILRSCEERLKDVQGRVEVLSVSAHAEGGPSVEQHDSVEVPQAPPAKEPDAVAQISETMQKQSISTESQGSAQGKPQRRCRECNVLVEDKLYREHCKSGWHKHNYTRHKNGLPPLSQEECMVGMELADSKKDLKDYDF